MLSLLGTAITLLANLYLLVLIVRMVIDWVHFLVPAFTPRGLVLVLANAVYALTDPPIRALRRVVPPLRLGSGIALDLGFMIVFIAVVLIGNLGRFLSVVGYGLF